MNDLTARIAAEQDEQIRHEAVATSRRRAAAAREAGEAGRLVSRPDRVAMWAFLMALAVTIAAAASAQAASSGGVAHDRPRPQGTWTARSPPGTAPASGATRPPAARPCRHRTVGVAHRRLPCGTEVTILYKGNYLTTEVIDRGPFANDADLGPDPGRGGEDRLHRDRRDPHVGRPQQPLAAGSGRSGGLRQVVRVARLARQLGRARDEALELVQRQVRERLDDLLVRPADLAGLLLEVLVGPAVGLEGRGEEGEQRLLARRPPRRSCGRARSRRGRARRGGRGRRAGRRCSRRCGARRRRGRSAGGCRSESTPARSSERIRMKARSAEGESARTPISFETEPPAVETPLRIGTLPSGAVSSSWMSKRL